MRLEFNTSLAKGYSSSSQKARILTEDWVDNEIYCPNCGRVNIDHYENNKPVADFYCNHCHEDFELKSKQDSVGSKIVDGAYSSMIERLNSSTNPNFFLLTYHSNTVTNFFVVPKHFMIPEIIEKRKPLALTAQRAGWIGCNILLNQIPDTGKIFLIRNQIIEPKERVLAEWKKTLFLREEHNLASKGWLINVMRCVQRIGKKDFELNDMYRFENELRQLYPENKYIKDKIRQQLQVLRDRGYLDFTERGKYRLT